MTVITGKDVTIVVSGATISGTGKGGMEATLNLGQTHDTFLPVGTQTPEVLTGLKTVTGTVRQAWYSGGSSPTFLTLVSGDTMFDVTLSKSAGVIVTATGCKVDTWTVRATPGTDIMTEEISFTGTGWGP